jgi:hypothetical protein
MATRAQTPRAPLDLLAHEEVRSHVSLLEHPDGTCVSLPFCRARFGIRFSVVSLRLISPLDTSVPRVRRFRRGPLVTAA